MPRVSVLLTCYNHLPYLKLAYACLLAQTFADFEIIALDDGSSDGTREWLSELSEPRLRMVLNEQNLGTYGTINKGIGLAKGEFIAIFNDDDLWAPEKLARQVELFDSDETLGLVHTSGWFIDGSGEKMADPAPLGFPFPHLPTGYVLPNLIDHNQIITSSAMFSRAAVERVGLFDASFYGCGDWQMWIRIARYFKVGLVDEPLCLYRVHGANAAMNDEKMNEDSRRIREWITTWQEEEKNRAELQPAFTHNWACLGTERTWNGDAAGGRRAYAQSIARMPFRFKSYLRYLLTFLPTKTFRKLA